MNPLVSDATVNSFALVVIALIGIIPTSLAAVWARNARDNSADARDNSEHARTNSADALHEVKANGGITDPDPTLKDYIKYVGELADMNSRRLAAVEDLLDSHITHSKMMDAALAEVYLSVKARQSLE